MSEPIILTRQQREEVEQRTQATLGNRPFYWTRLELLTAKGWISGHAPSGWYQWTDSGIVYLGESILEPVEAE